VALNLPILIAGVGHILLAVVLIAIMPEEGFQPQAQEVRISWKTMFGTFQDGIRLVRGRSVLIAILTISAIYGISSMGFDNLWTVHMLENFTFPNFGNFEPVVWFGAFNIVVSVLGLAGMEIVRRRVDMSRQRVIVRVLSFLSGATAICMVIFGIAGNFWLAASAFCLSLILRTISVPLLKTWVNLNVESNVRATVLSMEEQFFSLGETVGGPALGALGSLVSLPAALVATGLARLPVAFLFLRFLVKNKEEPVIDTA
jgi:DHA3 family tetracycline resistance protein-like MFS transporter